MIQKDKAVEIIRDALVDAYAYGSDAKLPNVANYIYTSLEKSGAIIAYPTAEITTAVEEVVKASSLEIEDAVANVMLGRAYTWLLKNERSPSNEKHRRKAAEDLLVALFSKEFA